MVKITLFALHLGYGGIEKAISSFSNNMIDNYDIEIISTYKLFEKPVFDINNKVKITYLLKDNPNKKELIDALKRFKFLLFFKECIKAIKILFLRKREMIKAIKNCHSDFGITTRSMHNKWLSKYGNNIKCKIGWEHNNRPNDIQFTRNVAKSTKGLDYFVVVSKGLKKAYEQYVSKTKVIYIPNFIDEIPKKPSLLNEKNIIAIGRFSYEKGFCDLIDIFNEFVKIEPNWKLNLIGDGKEMPNIKERIEKYKLNNSVILHGFKDKEYINEFFLKSSIYVMTSYEEALPIVILEAFSYGLPVVAFDCAEGAKELITNNKTGFLIENRNHNKMIDKLNMLSNNYKLRREIGHNAYLESHNYSCDKIRKKWMNIIK